MAQESCGQPDRVVILCSFHEINYRPDRCYDRDAMGSPFTSSEYRYSTSGHVQRQWPSPQDGPSGSEL